jgi:ferric-dicitrate binding protein FerR (iron transport regulator)
MNIDHYKSFSTEDFILDDNFSKLTRGQSVDGITLDQFKSLLPEKNKEIAFAIEIRNGLTTKKKATSTERKAEMLNEILHSRKHTFIRPIFRYAAAVLLIIGLGISSLWLFNSQTDIEDFASSTNIKSQNAELILADGKRIEIENKQSKIEYATNGSSVSLNDSSKLEQSEPASGKCFNQVIVPFGKRSNILLSDGSKVWLNSGSKLVYPPVFTDVDREVFLEGEAYFEIAKNENRSFYVRTSNFRVKVLGTKFNVQAYKDENEQSTVLLEGKVNIAKNEKLFSKGNELSPNQKATFLSSGNNFVITDVENAENYIAWIYGYLPVENQDIVSLSKRISRYYDVDIEVKAKNVNLRFSGKLDLKSDPKRILDALSTISKLKYKQQGDKFVIYE